MAGQTLAASFTGTIGGGGGGNLSMNGLGCRPACVKDGRCVGLPDPHPAATLVSTYLRRSYPVLLTAGANFQGTPLKTLPLSLSNSGMIPFLSGRQAFWQLKSVMPAPGRAWRVETGILGILASLACGARIRCCAIACERRWPCPRRKLEYAVKRRMLELHA